VSSSTNAYQELQNLPIQSFYLMDRMELPREYLAYYFYSSTYEIVQAKDSFLFDNRLEPKLFYNAADEQFVEFVKDYFQNQENHVELQGKTTNILVEHQRLEVPLFLH
jgi:hypothetical protein